MKRGNFKCTDSINGWNEDNYQIDFESDKSRKYAIWNCGKWCISGIKSVKKAFEILKEEFKEVVSIN